MYVVQTGAKFYKPLSALLPAIAAGMTYTPVTRADLAKGYPTAGWNESSAAAAAASRAAHKQPAALAADDRAEKAAAPDPMVWLRPGGYAAALGVQKPQRQSSDASATASPTAAGSGAAAGLARGSKAWVAALQQLLRLKNVKWRAIVPSGDRVGPFTSSELLSWLQPGSSSGVTAPKGVSKDDANRVSASPGALQLCGILSTDYSNQKLPGEAGKQLVIVGSW